MIVTFKIFLVILMVALLIGIFYDSKPKKKSWRDATVPKPMHHISKEEDFIEKLKEIKRLTLRGKHKRAAELLATLEIPYSVCIPSNTNTISVNPGRLKE